MLYRKPEIRLGTPAVWDPRFGEGPWKLRRPRAEIITHFLRILCGEKTCVCGE